MAEVTHSTLLIRRDDLLALRFDFTNLKLNEHSSHLVRIDQVTPATIVIYFPPQHIAEEAFHQSSTGQEPPGAIPVRARLAGESRIVFRLPDEMMELPYTVEAFLDWRQFEPLVAPNALPADARTGPALAPLTGEETAIEFPYRLYLSPDAQSYWLHAVKPIEHIGWVELWHCAFIATNDLSRRSEGFPTYSACCRLCAARSISDSARPQTVGRNYPAQCRFWHPTNHPTPLAGATATLYPSPSTRGRSFRTLYPTPYHR
ncbi:MAG: hypothetical protein R2932_00010 [Caldilineaceae bacterium]